MHHNIYFLQYKANFLWVHRGLLLLSASFEYFEKSGNADFYIVSIIAISESTLMTLTLPPW